MMRSKENYGDVIDGCWAWMAVLASFVILNIYSGCSYSFGILFPNLLEYFGESKSKTAWIGSLFFSVPLLCGPIAGLITDKLGYRKSTIFGGVLAAIGFIAGAFVNSTEMLCVTYGLIGGFGMSMPYLTATAAIPIYFTRRRTLASGIAECGAGIGTVVFAPLTTLLTSQYGWRGTMLVLGGIIANIVVCGALYRPVEINKFESCSWSCCFKKADKERKNERAFRCQLDHELQNTSVLQQCYLNDCTTHERHEHPVSTARIWSSSVVMDEINQHTSSFSGATEQQESQERQGDRRSSEAKRYQMVKEWIFENIIDFSVFANKYFLLFSMLHFIMYFCYDIPNIFLPDMALHKGESDFNSAFLISTIGITNTIGCIVCGLISNRKELDNTVIYGISIFLCGLCMFLLPYFSTYGLLVVFAGGNGLFSAANEALCPIILTDVVGLSKLNRAYGTIMLVEGLASLVGPPAFGLLFDLTNDYVATFSTGGAMVMAAAIIYLSPRIVVRFLKRKTTYDLRKEESSTDPAVYSLRL